MIDIEVLNAMVNTAFRMGHELGTLEAERNVEERLDNAFDEGFEQGAAFQELEDVADAEQTADECYEDGYLDGVADAQHVPASAEEQVMRILNERAGEHYDQLEMVFDEA